ncbi:hypothetical protein TNCT_345371 [Trichonephila clavata]|uniref:Uncharacterized protein n=1 Tax=Trichonephila clavata TaxID=2740835 RepID=A0A8X6I2J9_TRICU|nr:hypothetical protein TNCT_345371 [Trichonephila clavata]
MLRYAIRKAPYDQVSTAIPRPAYPNDSPWKDSSRWDHPSFTISNNPSKLHGSPKGYAPFARAGTPISDDPSTTRKHYAMPYPSCMNHINPTTSQSTQSQMSPSLRRFTSNVSSLISPRVSCVTVRHSCTVVRFTRRASRVQPVWGAPELYAPPLGTLSTGPDDSHFAPTARHNSPYGGQFLCIPPHCHLLG